MAEETSDIRVPMPPPSRVVVCLSILAVLCAGVGVAGAGALLVGASRAGSLGAGAVLWALAALAGGCGAGAALWALGWLCRSAHQRLLAARGARATAVAAWPAPAEPAPRPARAPEPATTAPRFDEVLEQLRELNVNVLLTERERRAKRERLTAREAEGVAGEVERHLASGELAAAGEQLDRLVRVAPDYEGLDALRERIERARADAEAADVEQATRRVEDLMATGSFDEALTVADELLDRHRSAPAAIALLDRVRRERRALENERREQMYAKVQKAASARRWREAMAAAREFLHAYTEGHEADAVRAQWETITDNARIEEVRELRDRIRDLIDRRRFAEAVELARDLVGRFPDTAAAQELRGQLARLEALARDGGGARA